MQGSVNYDIYGRKGMKLGVSVIIRCMNEERFIGQTLDAVFNQAIEIPFEVIVVDSGSTDRTLDIVRKFNVRLCEIKRRQFTFGRALNYGIGLAEGEYVINLSAHCIPVDSLWMANLLKPMMDDTSTAATFGKQEPIKGLNPFEEMALITDFSPDENGNILPVFSNSNCAIRKSVWAENKFDEEASVAEDFIWARKLPKEYPIRYVPESSVYHSHPLNIRYWSKRYYGDGLAVFYMEYIYGIRFPWTPPANKSAGWFLKNFLSTINSYWAEIYHINSFLIRRKYYYHVLISPVFVFFRRYYYRKGLEDGRKRYAHARNE